MKKLFGLLFIALLLVVPTAYATDNEPVKVYLFHGSTCPHCQELLEWFDTQEEANGDKYDLVKYEVWEDEKNSELLSLTANYLGLDTSNLGVPFMIIGEEQFSGFDPNEDPAVIMKAIESEYAKDASERSHIVDDVINTNNWVHDEKEDENKARRDNLIVGVVSVLVIVGVVFVIMKAREE